MFIGSVGLACVYLLWSEWTVGLGFNYEFAAFLVLVVAVPAIIVRLVLACLRSPLDDTAFLVRVSAAPVLLVGTIALLMGGVPHKVRFGLSEDALNEYARTVTATQCDRTSFEKRRVGLYTVVCASRYGDRNEMVDLEIRDRLTSEDWHIGGIPGDWVFELRD
ncbi:hypothetical protein Acsp03_36670 [Actinomadura sp. NBRC 104412]|nr:hypothetical protein Acsp03_36670 [Actinomadura sp. NBRC 104412]